ncbi:MAG: endo alpha-1,4 polygalactosaminidase [Myxococcota bacterium]
MLAGCSGLSGFGVPGARTGDAFDQADLGACLPGSFCNPHVAGPFPYVHEGDTRDLVSTVDSYGCAPDTNESGGEVVYRVDLLRAGRISASIVEISGDGIDVDVHLLSGTDPASQCIARDNVGIDEEVDPGTYWVVVDTWTHRNGRPAAGPYTLTIDFEPAPQWRPAPGASWHWQLVGDVAPDLPVDVAVLDLYGPDGSIASQQAKVVCSFSAGTAEDWQDDTGAFPWDAVGLPVVNALGVYWVDVRDDGVRQVMAGRLDEAVARGCDGVDPRDLNGFSQDTGFGLTSDDARDYLLWLADEAHARGLSIAVHDVPEIAPSVSAAVDLALAESCLARGTCGAFDPYIAAGKAVLHVERAGTPAEAEAAYESVCDDPARERFSTVLKLGDTSAWQLACPRTDLYAALTALTSSCSVLPGTSAFRTDADQPRTLSVCALDGAIWWTADFDIDCDGGQESSCTSDPYYQSSTSAVDSSGDYLDANSLPFVVVPLASNGFDYRDHGLSMGSVVAVLYDGQVQFAVIGDAGPRGVLGEGSYALAEALGMNPHPIAGGVSSGVTYVHFTGADARVQPIEDPIRAFDLGVQQAWDLVNDN